MRLTLQELKVNKSQDRAEPYRRSVRHLLHHRRIGNCEQPGAKHPERSKQPGQQYHLH
jgi:hypothetical protein